MFPIKSQHAADPAHHNTLSLGRKHVEVPGSYEMTDEGTGVRDHYLLTHVPLKLLQVPAPALQLTVQNTSFMLFPIPGLPY